jgi:hypothetical protein
VRVQEAPGAIAAESWLRLLDQPEFVSNAAG